MPFPPKVTQIMGKYQELFNQAFPGRLFGLYLLGSIALGAYREGKSDLDFLAVIHLEFQPAELTKLAEIHHAIARLFPGAVLEGGYLTPGDLGKNGLWIPYYHDGHFKRSDITIITWFTFKKHGIPLLGPAPRDLPFSVTAEDLHRYIQENLDVYWDKWLKGLKTPGSFARFTGLFPQKVEWGVLGIARLYYTLRENEIVSKERAGEYALSLIPGVWRRIVTEALRIRKGEKPAIWYSPWRRRQDAISFIDFMIQECKTMKPGLTQGR